jgi:acyl-CoA synthetase (AMP-forming)/AMP-acid ligase II
VWVGRGVRLGSARTGRIALVVLALLSFAAMIPLTSLAHQVSNGVIAVVIGVPCAVVGCWSPRRQPANPVDWPATATESGSRRLRRRQARPDAAFKRPLARNRSGREGPGSPSAAVVTVVVSEPVRRCTWCFATARPSSLGVTHASLFAAPVRMILARRTADELPLALEHIWFAQNLGAEHYEHFARLTGTRPRQIYGMTETVAVVCADISRPFTNDVIGTPLPGRRVHIAGPGGEGAAPPGVPGELSVLGTPGRYLFAGYLDDEQTTAKVFQRAAGLGQFQSRWLTRTDSCAGSRACDITLGQVVAAAIQHTATAA